ncbi:PTS mannose transporter subunit IIAB [Erysipelothrix larvae]|uniref:PTS mannose transporter subunit IIAB n=1 Tax=Erysipelothrix larvae TaxID=1514105 RepID=A0A120JTZ3_9FIRM|nr:PTS sugar transporter subunit IIB [Erysipelothrix larvae]AMC94412.1 PTS mannose transporter subunit IIAB [Erysipelothrix larvae]
MNIVNARVDERLIHGQVAMVWTNTIKADRIVVVNDEIIGDEMQIAALKIAKPAGVKLSLLSKERALIRLSDNSYDGQNIFLITKTVADMVFLAKNLNLKSINIGNVAAKDGSRSIKKSVSLTEAEISQLQDLVNDGIIVTAQMLPTETDSLITTMF